MQKDPFVFSVALIGMSAMPFAPTPAADADGARPLVIVITGESNSGGTAKNADATPRELAPRPAVHILHPDPDKLRFEELRLGVNNLREHSGLEKHYEICHGFENGLAGAVEGGAFPGRDRVWLIKTGHGGSRISQWAPDDSSGYWATFVKRIDAAKRQLPPDPQWVVWMSLGINDAIAETPPDSWRDDVIRHIERMRKELPGAIVVMTQFQSMNRYPRIDRAIAEIAARVPGVYAVDTSGATLADANHWDHAGSKVVAARMVEKTVAASVRPQTGQRGHALRPRVEPRPHLARPRAAAPAG